MSDVSNEKPVTLITGGSDGIGLALAECFAERGDTLFLVARNHNQLRIAADKIQNLWKTQVHIASFDLMQKGAASQLTEHIVQQGFYVDKLVNSAAISFLGSFEDSDIDGVKALVQLNITSTTELIHKCLPAMRKHGGGGVLNIASLSGLLPVPNLALYSASKSYMISLTRAINEEMRGSDIKISVLVPGPVDTRFIQHGGTAMQNLTPMLTSKSVARVGYEGFMAGQTVITPGFLGAFYRLGVKVLPHKLFMRTLNPLLKRIYTQ
ncbi:MAG: SDR family NAD(P)-dependent oxidoreductase [bacterium]|nr:SDR family NAD(P)-dependent oxidoreductase [bacterium]